LEEGREGALGGTHLNTERHICEKQRGILEKNRVIPEKNEVILENISTAFTLLSSDTINRMIKFIQ